MFYGEFRHQVDDRNRIRIPFRFKDELGKDYIFCRADDGVIAIYSTARAKEKFAFLENVSPFDRKAARFAANFLSGLYGAEDDGHGRVIIPEPLRDMLSSKDVVSIGVGDHIELMSADTREELKKVENEEDYLSYLDQLYTKNNG